jgi:tartrate dehydratase alpha subunit/fumarate hydratase class I-like protein
MSASSFSARRIATAAALVGAVGTIGLGMASTADAAAKVTVKVTQKGNYTAAICVGDILEARCTDNVGKGQTKTFTVAPPKGTAVSVSVIVKGGGSADKSVVSNKTQLKFETAGSKSKPVVKQV